MRSRGTVITDPDRHSRWTTLKGGGSLGLLLSGKRASRLAARITYAAHLIATRSLRLANLALLYRSSERVYSYRTVYR